MKTELTKNGLIKYAATPETISMLVGLRDRINSITLPSADWLDGIWAYIADEDGGGDSEAADGRPVWLAIDISLHSTHGQRDEMLRDSAHSMAVRAVERIVGSDLVETGEGCGDGVSIESYAAVPKSLKKYVVS